jgi:hypothetical protein
MMPSWFLIDAVPSEIAEVDTEYIAVQHVVGLIRNATVRLQFPIEGLNMKERLGEKREMPDVPKQDFVDALAEIWFQINFAAYHMAYVRVYSQSEALRTATNVLREQDQDVRNHVQIDIVICRSHLAAFFWHLEHVFEALRTAITRGQKEYPEARYFGDMRNGWMNWRRCRYGRRSRTIATWRTSSLPSLAASGLLSIVSFIIFCRQLAGTRRKKMSK